MELKPLTVSDIKLRVPYIRFMVDLDGNMEMKEVTFFDKPFQRGDAQLIRISRKKPVYDFDAAVYSFVGDLGLDPERRFSCHRVFDNTPENRRALAEFIRRRDQVGYLEAIGDPNPFETISSQRQLADA